MGWQIDAEVWWTFMGGATVAGLSAAGLHCVGWPGFIAGALIGAELTWVALLRR